MRLVADEGVDRAIVERLRQDGHTLSPEALRRYLRQPTCTIQEVTSFGFVGTRVPSDLSTLLDFRAGRHV